MPFPTDFPVIESPRLVLRAFAPTDALAVQFLAGAKEVSDTTLLIPHPYSSGLAEEWIATHTALWAAREQLCLAITLKENGTLIGATSLSFAHEHQRAELGYWIGVPFWRCGFATEAATALTDFAFRVLGMNRVQAHHFARNTPSGRVLLKSGMKREGASPRAVLKNGRFEDVIFYGVLRRDWPGLPGGSTPPFVSG